MAQAKYTLYKYVKLSGGKWRYCRSALYKNHTIKPNIVKVGGKEEAHSEGDYYIAHEHAQANAVHVLAVTVVEIRKAFGITRTRTQNGLRLIHRRLRLAF